MSEIEQLQKEILLLTERAKGQELALHALGAAICAAADINEKEVCRALKIIQEEIHSHIGEGVVAQPIANLITLLERSARKTNDSSR